ncbi:aldo/keto reductase [Actinobacteria bacterium YIM 96077]|uniref:Aldo/keto reductase n=1 Tax=Phytoactinopolyspora halophila TaxID=1981511 RepID=A0A329QH44_9ACTN|nr:aldo/keto reductase [Phytoactinopolyspora halophila]AYY14679.1 aldo/keto reductase [Actinobacteria bacterium YIM 96077]RAW11610.1 aldo/keto reductase [Phytoactinopolyspora halophila]
MQTRTFGRLGHVSALTLGGGGLGQVWGPTSRDEAVSTVRAAVDAGIDFVDVAPGYGDGEAERVVGEAFAGVIPDGVRVSTKSHVGRVDPENVRAVLENSLDDSLARMRVQHVDLFILHGHIVERDDQGNEGRTPAGLFREAVRPAFDDLVRRGRIGAWGITAVDIPETVIRVLDEEPVPAAAQCVTNPLDSPGDLMWSEEDPRPRDIIATARRRDIGVMGIRAVQAGALTDGPDRELPAQHPTQRDFRRAEPLRELAREAGVSIAALAHRYALSMDGVDTVVLGVKNRAELRECLEAEAAGPLDSDLVEAIETRLPRRAAT